VQEPSPRETEVLELVGSRLSNRQIGERLYISVRTVESHVASLIRKLEVADRRELVTYASEQKVDASGIAASRVRDNLPLPRSSFIGRGVERGRLQEMVLREPLITLTGIGGCGKTRLALEVASGLVGDFDDGVFFIDLSAVTDSTLVGPAVSGALKLQILDPTPDALADYFEDRETLLVVDNCEHLLDACADVADALLERCPRTRILATSREALGVDGEWVFPVPSLDIEGEAVALFGERALSARPDLQLDSTSEATIVEICRRLDGIPLAIELAAARAAHLSITEILERLNDRFRLLVGGSRRVQRQQTLTAALDWSYDLLGPDERSLLGRLAVFRGSFSLSAAEAICHPQALELVGSLVDKSLVSVIDRGGDVRYRLFESVRLYADGKLVETGESEQFRSAHRDYYLEWIESLPLDVRGHRVLGTLLLVPEADNLTAALEWCRHQGRYDLCACIAANMSSYWFAFYRASEMKAWWRQLEAGIPAEDYDHRAKALLVGGWAALRALEWEELNKRSAQALALADPHSWVGMEAQYLQAVCWSVTDPPRGDDAFERLFEIEANIGGSPYPVAHDLFYVSRLQRATSGEEALAILDDWIVDVGDSTPTTYMPVAFALYGETQTALELMSRAALLPRGLPLGQFVNELHQTVWASTQAKFDEAERHLATLTAFVRDFAVARGEAACLVGFAKVALDRGDFGRASHLLATVDSRFGPGNRSLGDPTVALVYAHCKGVLGEFINLEIT